MFSESAASQYLSPLSAPGTYDALLFVEKTTAARKNAAGVQFEIRAVGDSKEYRDPDYGVVVALPAGWSTTQATRWGDHETTVVLNDAQSQAVSALYFKAVTTPRKTSREEIRRLLRADAEAKVAQRTASGLSGYRIRQDSYQVRKINGREALSCVADYMQEGREMAEYLVRVGSDQITAMFFARIPAGELDRFRERFDRIANTLKLPR